MPAPKRYAEQVPQMSKIWEPEGYFKAQVRIWEAQSEARHKLYNKPTSTQLTQIKAALKLTSEDIDLLTQAKGHETNNLLRLIQERLTPEAGNYIHRGNTGSDVLDTSLSLQILESLDEIKAEFIRLAALLKKLALKHKDTLQIGRTHTQHAIPHTFGRQVLGWYAEVLRGIERIERAKNVISVGKLSGEIGTNVFIEPKVEELTLKKLGLKPDTAPTQIISRDRHAEVLSLMAVNAATLARIATNIRLLAMTDVGELREPFDAKNQQGSSAMPHKRNTELTERIVGLNRTIRSSAAEELDSIISWLERDISHSSTERYTFPDVFQNLSYVTKLTCEVIDGLEVNSGQMRINLEKTYGAIYSSRLLNTLMDKGDLSRTDAYELVKGLAQKAMDTQTSLFELASSNPQINKSLGVKELAGLFDPSFYLKNIDVSFKRSGILGK